MSDCRSRSPQTVGLIKVVVAIDSDTDLALVEEGCQLAREHNARLELVAGIPRPSRLTAHAFSDLVALAHEITEHQTRLLRKAAHDVPPELPVTMRCVRGSAATNLLGARARSGEVMLIRDGPLRPAWRLGLSALLRRRIGASRWRSDVPRGLREADILYTVRSQDGNQTCLFKPGLRP